MAELRLGSGRAPWLPLLVLALAGSAVLTLLSSEFLTGFNIYVILSQASLLSIIGFSQMTALSVGEFSLAVGGIGELTGVLVGYLLITKGAPLVPSVLSGLLFSAVLGGLNGVLVTVSAVSGFIVTLATGGLFTGAALAVTQSSAYTNLPAELNSFGTGRVGFLPFVASAAVFAALTLGVLYSWRLAGRRMLAVGGNPEAARLSGLSRPRAVIWAHTLSGLLAGGAGLVAMSQLHQANPLVGMDWLLQSFTIPIIGGTSLLGGSVSIFGTLIASIILATINDGLILIHVNPYWVTLTEGVLVFLAVLLGRVDVVGAYRRIFDANHMRAGAQ